MGVGVAQLRNLVTDDQKPCMVSRLKIVGSFHTFADTSTGKAYTSCAACAWFKKRTLRASRDFARFSGTFNRDSLLSYYCRIPYSDIIKDSKCKLVLARSVNLASVCCKRLLERRAGAGQPSTTLAFSLNSE